MRHLRPGSVPVRCSCHESSFFSDRLFKESDMKIRLLSTALLAGLAVVQVASAQDFDDRWYLTGSAGINIQDNDRGTRNAPFVPLGLGKFISPHWSPDGG